MLTPDTREISSLALSGAPSNKPRREPELSMTHDRLNRLRSELWNTDYDIGHFLEGVRVLGSNPDWKKVLAGTASLTQRPGMDWNMISPTWRNVIDKIQSWMEGLQGRSIAFNMKKYNISATELQARVKELAIYNNPLWPLHNHMVRTDPETYGFMLNPKHIAQADHLEWMILRGRAIKELVKERKYRDPNRALAYLNAWGTSDTREQERRWKQSYPTLEEAEWNKPDLSQYPSKVADTRGTSTDNESRAPHKPDFFVFEPQALRLIAINILWHKRYIWEQTAKLTTEANKEWISGVFSRSISRYLT